MVRYTPPLTFGPGHVDWQQRIDPRRLREERAAWARQFLQERGVAAVLAGGSQYGRYLSGLRGPEYTPDLWYILFTAEDGTLAFTHAGYVTTLPSEAPWIDEWRVARAWLRGIPGKAACVAEAADFAKDVTTELNRLGLGGEPLAVAGFDSYARAALEESGIHVIDGDELLQEAMATKTPQEVDCLRMAGAITDRMWAAMAREIRAGMTDAEASAIGASAGRTGGADNVKAGWRAGPLAAERGIKGTNQFINHGDLLIGNVCGTSYLGYRSCVYRTFVVGREPTTEERGWMEKLQEQLNNVVASLRVGNDTRDAALHFPPASAWGYQQEVEVLTIEIGHGIGLNQYERPVVNRQWSLDHPQELRQGMVIAVEGREGAVGRSTVRLESMVVVTEDGPQVIDRFPTGITRVG